jgi:hypothetical protein
LTMVRLTSDDHIFDSLWVFDHDVIMWAPSLWHQWL